MPLLDFKRALASLGEGKAIPAHPALLSGDPYTTYSPGMGNSADTRLRISQREASRHSQAYGGDDAIDWVMDAVRLYSDSASAADYHLERKGKKVWLEREEATPDDAEVLNDNTLKLLLSLPNPYMPWSELIELLVIDLLLVGNAYWFKWRTTAEGKPLAIYRLAPSYVKVIPGPLGAKQYEYQPPGIKDPLLIDPAQMVHYKLPNPHSNYWGLGIIQGGARALDLELALTDAQAWYYEKKADPSMIVQSERRVPRDVFNKLRLQLRARAGGRQNAGELLVLEAGLKASTLSPSARDALYAEVTRLSRDRIFAMFRASPKLFGIVDETGGTDKITDARREFDTYVMKPFLKKLGQRMSISLFQAWGLDYIFDYNYAIPQEDLVKLSGDFAATPGIKVKEVRRFMLPLGVLDGESTGDTDIDEMVLNLPGENMDANGDPVQGDAAIADRNLPREAGRPPKGSNTSAFPRQGAPLPAGAAVRRPQSKAMDPDDAIARLNELQRVEEAKALIPGEIRPPDVAEADRDDGVNAAANVIEKALADAALTLERGLLDHSEGKAFDPSTLVKRVRNSESWKTFMTLISVAIERGAVQALSSAAIHQGGLGNVPDEDLDYEAIAKEIVFRENGVRSITDNLKSEIVQKIAKAIKEGADREAVDQVIREAITFWRETQAETVALTEAVHAYNEGTLQVAEATGHTHVLVSDGRDDDQPCIDADGQIWEIEHAHRHRLEHPRCRRAFVPLTGTVG